MTDKELEAIKLHVAGVSVRHTSPFNEMNSFSNGFQLAQEFRALWVMPFYAKIGRVDNDWKDLLLSVKNEISPKIISDNLGDFNWRTRQTGAFFSAITNQLQFIDIIGVHLLKSEVVHAGHVYTTVLASFNTERCINYLNLYLDYYLKKPDLWFDQRSAMEAVKYLDRVNGTNYLERHLEDWSLFIENKTGWIAEISTSNLENQLRFISEVRDAK